MLASTYHGRGGFTLIELSIVLVIIGLIVGGVLVGRDLIKSAEIRSQITQIAKLNTAVNTFKTKYEGLPGDLLYTKAQGFGIYSVTYAPYVGYAGYGDGNGLITPGNGATYTLATDYTFYNGEPYIFWRHLSDAGLIEESLGKRLNTAGEPNGGLLSTYLPLAKIGTDNTIEANNAGDGQHYYVLTKGSAQAYFSHFNPANPLMAREAQTIDQKIDDGLPATGTVIAINSLDNLDTAVTWRAVSGVSGCVASSAYAITQTTQSCSLRFKFQ